MVEMPKKLQFWSLEKLKPYERNSREHSPEQIKRIAESMKTFGFTNPILVDGDNGIIAGHGRLSAAKELGLDKVPVIQLEHLTDEQRRAYIIADNRLAELSTWNNEILKSELSDLQELGFDLELIGFDQEQLTEIMPPEKSEPLTDEDAVPEVEDAPVVKRGDTWILGNHRLRCGDSTSAEDVALLMNGEKADMVFTDPPYGVSYVDSKGRKIQNDELTDDKLEAFLASAFHAGVKFCSVNCAWFVWHADRFSTEFVSALKKSGLRVRQQIIWVKGEGREGTAEVAAPAIGGSHFRFLHEPCWYASLGAPYNAGDRKTTTVWTVTRQTTGTIHPTQKPVALIEIALENSSKQNHIVLDLFGGSGSTLIACEKMDRNARLMELDEVYATAIIRRWQEYTGKDAYHAETGETFNSLAAK